MLTTFVRFVSLCRRGDNVRCLKLLLSVWLDMYALALQSMAYEKKWEEPRHEVPKGAQGDQCHTVKSSRIFEFRYRGTLVQQEVHKAINSLNLTTKRSPPGLCETMESVCNPCCLLLPVIHVLPECHCPHFCTEHQPTMRSFHQLDLIEWLSRRVGF